MKTVFILLALVTASPAFACKSFIAKSEISKAIALEPGAGSVPCGKDDPCICFDGIDWESAEWDGKFLKNNSEKSEAKAKRLAAEAAAKEVERVSEIAIFKKIEEGTATAAEVRTAVKFLLKSRAK